MPDSTIKQVEKWAEKDKDKEGWTFRDRNKMPFTFDDDVDTSMMVTPPIPTPYWEKSAEFPGVNLERHLSIITEHDGNNTNVIRDEDEWNNFPAAAMAATRNKGLEDPHQAPTHPDANIIPDDDSAME